MTASFPVENIAVKSCNINKTQLGTRHAISMHAAFYSMWANFEDDRIALSLCVG